MAPDFVEPGGERTQSVLLLHAPDPALLLRSGRGRAFFAKQRCYDCHHEPGATGNVFTQFYPVLRR